MSIEKMIAEHPDVAGHDNVYLAKAVRHAMYCAAITNSCADACSAEKEDRTDCIRLCMDASDICAATYRVASRRAGSNEAVLRATLELCAQACDRCAEMCETMTDDHCARCAKMCRETSEDCRTAASNL
jgi:hypothetical protein